MAVIRANNGYRAVHVARRLNTSLVVMERYAVECPPRAKPADALADLAALMSQHGKYSGTPAALLTPFAVAFGWLLLVYGAVQAETALRLEVDPVQGLVGYVSQLAGEIRFIGKALLSCDPLVGEETLLDHLRGCAALSRALPDPLWYQCERERVAQGAGGPFSLLTTGGTRYRFFFDAADSAENQRERLVAILVPLITAALGYCPLALEGCRSLLRRLLKAGWDNENWQPIHIRTLFGARTSVQYERLMEECFEVACTRMPQPKGGVH